MFEWHHLVNVRAETLTEGCSGASVINNRSSSRHGQIRVGREGRAHRCDDLPVTISGTAAREKQCQTTRIVLSGNNINYHLHIHCALPDVGQPSVSE